MIGIILIIPPPPKKKWIKSWVRPCTLSTRKYNILMRNAQVQESQSPRFHYGNWFFFFSPRWRSTIIVLNIHFRYIITDIVHVLKGKQPERLPAHERVKREINAGETRACTV